jgi:predicted TPR repeat methyltransferase
VGYDLSPEANSLERPLHAAAIRRLGEALEKVGREDEAHAAYEAGVNQAEKFGHAGMAEDLKLALIGLGER